MEAHTYIRASEREMFSALSSSRQICFCFNCIIGQDIDIDATSGTLARVDVSYSDMNLTAVCCVQWCNYAMHVHYMSVHVSINVCMWMCVCSCDQLRCMYFTYQEIWCFCPNHSFSHTHTHTAIRAVRSFASRNWLHFRVGILSTITLIHLALAPLNSNRLSRSLFLSRLLRIRSEYINHVHSIFSSISMNGLFTTLSISLTFGSPFLCIFSPRYCFGKMCLAIAIRERYQNVIDYEMVNFMAHFTHTVHLSQNRSTASRQFNRFFIGLLFISSPPLSLPHFLSLPTFQIQSKRFASIAYHISNALNGKIHFSFSLGLKIGDFIGKKISITRSAQYLDALSRLVLPLV